MTTLKNTNEQSLTQDLKTERHYSEDDLLYYAEKFSMGIDLDLHPEIMPDILPGSFMRQRNIVPVEINDNTIKIASSDPLDWETIKDIEFITGLNAEIILTHQSNITEAIEERMGAEDIYSENEGILDIDILSQKEDNVSEINNLQAIAEQPPIIRLVNIILIEAIRGRTTDIHIEPRKDFVNVRFRVDGHLEEYTKLSKKLSSSIISRIKIMSQLNISVRNKPQDGSFTIAVNNSNVDVRVNTMPSLYGEKAVLRLLNKGDVNIELDTLGFSSQSLQSIRQMVDSPNGIIFVSGPTGSGKTTTLYSIINEISSDDTNIVTIEDPVEYKLEAVTQTDISGNPDITFASALRALLRQDPDVILLGEIRDEETANIAVQAAITGHLVLTTIHTNDAVSVINRLRSMNINPDMISDSILGIIAQRLVRKLNTDGHSKYRGRTVIEEVVRFNSQVKQMVEDNAKIHNIKKYLIADGFKTMQESGLDKVKEGIIDMEELKNVIDMPDDQNSDDEQSTDNKSDSAQGDRRILIVDDSRTIRMMIRPLLEDNGYEVIESEDGSSALDLISQKKFDLVILDLMMPGIDGFEVIKRIRESSHNNDLRVIMLTSDNVMENELKGFNLGIDEFIPKPFMPEKLMARVNAIMRRIN
ncbi:MAG: type II/IV secretion system protein [bacterium]